MKIVGIRAFCLAPITVGISELILIRNVRKFSLSFSYFVFQDYSPMGPMGHPCGTHQDYSPRVLWVIRVVRTKIIVLWVLWVIHVVRTKRGRGSSQCIRFILEVPLPMQNAWDRVGGGGGGANTFCFFVSTKWKPPPPPLYQCSFVAVEFF